MNVSKPRYSELVYLLYRVSGSQEIRSLIISYAHPSEEYRLRDYDEDEAYLNKCVSLLKPTRNRFSMISLLNNMPSTLDPSLWTPLKAYLMRFACAECHNVMSLGSMKVDRITRHKLDLRQYPGADLGLCSKCNVNQLNLKDARDVMKRVNARFNVYILPCEHHLQGHVFEQTVHPITYFKGSQVSTLFAMAETIRDLVCNACCYANEKKWSSSVGMPGTRHVGAQLRSLALIKQAAREHQGWLNKHSVMLPLVLTEATAFSPRSFTLSTSEPPVKRRKLCAASQHSGGLGLARLEFVTQ